MPTTYWYYAATAILLPIIGYAAYWRIRFKNRFYFYGYLQGKKTVRQMGDKLWSEVKGSSGGTVARFQNFVEKVIEVSLDTRFKNIDPQLEILEAELVELKKRKEKIQTDLHTSHKDSMSKHVEKMFKDLNDEVVSMLDVKNFEKVVDQITKKFEEEYKRREKDAEERMKALNERIKNLEEHIKELQKQNNETLSKKEEAINVDDGLYQNVKSKLLTVLDELKSSILKIVAFLLTFVLFLVDFFVTQQAFSDIWARQIQDGEIITVPFFWTDITINYSIISTFAGLFVPVFLLIAFEMLLSHFWNKEARKNYLNQMTFILFILANLALFVLGFYYFVLSRVAENVSGLVDLMLVLFIIPTVTVAAFAIAKITDGKGFHFIFIPFEIVFFSFALLFTWISNGFQWTNAYMHRSSLLRKEIGKRLAAINHYKQEIESLNNQKGGFKAGLEQFRGTYIEKLKNLATEHYNLDEIAQRFASISSTHVQTMIGLDEKQKGLLDRELQVATRKHEKVESVIKKLNDQIDAYRDGVNAATFNHYTVPAN